MHMHYLEWPCKTFTPADAASWEDIQINGSLTNGPAPQALMGFYHLLPDSSTYSQSGNWECNHMPGEFGERRHRDSPPPTKKAHPRIFHIIRDADSPSGLITLRSPLPPPVAVRVTFWPGCVHIPFISLRRGSKRRQGLRHGCSLPLKSLDK